MTGRDDFPRAGDSPGDSREVPVDLAAMQADDTLLDILGSGGAPGDASDELTRVLAGWRREVDAEPQWRPHASWQLYRSQGSRIGSSFSLFQNQKKGASERVAPLHHIKEEVGLYGRDAPIQPNLLFYVVEWGHSLTKNRFRETLV